MNREELKKQYPYMTELQTKYDHVTCGKNIRAELKKNFPSVKFSVRYESFSMGDAYRVSWDDGPIVQEVDALLHKFASGRFDGMTDSSWTEIDDFNEVFGDVKYVSTSRYVTDKGRERVRQIFGIDESNYKAFDYLNCDAAKKYHKAAEAAIREINSFHNSTLDDVVSMMAHNMDLTEKSQPKAKKASEPEQTDNDGISIFDYSEKAFVVTGDTRKIKEDLKRLGGRFNARLTCGCGWVFKKADEDKVWDFLVSADIA